MIIQTDWKQRALKAEAALEQARMQLDLLREEIMRLNLAVAGHKIDKEIQLLSKK